MWEGVKVAHKMAFLKDDIVLLRFRLLNNYTTLFLLDLLWIMHLHGVGVLQNHVLQCGEVYYL